MIGKRAGSKKCLTSNLRLIRIRIRGKNNFLTKIRIYCFGLNHGKISRGTRGMHGDAMKLKKPKGLFGLLQLKGFFGANKK